VLFLALLLESMAAPTSGFYIFPALVIVGIFLFLPIVITSINICIAGLAGFFVSVAWTWKLLNYSLPSHGFIIHVAVYAMLLSLVLYVFSKK